MKHHQIAILFLLVLLAILSGCLEKLGPNFEPTPQGISVLAPSPDCEPPCWQGFQFGETSVLDAKNLLMSIDDINPDTINELDLDYEVLPTDIHRIQWRFLPPALEYAGRADFVDGHLAWLVFNANNSISFDEALEIYGEPKSVLVTIDSHDSKWTQIVLLYPEKGIALLNIIKEYPQSTVKIKPNMHVELVTYFDPGLYDLVAELSVPATAVEKGIWLKGLQSWQGFDYVYQVVE